MKIAQGTGLSSYRTSHHMLMLAGTKMSLGCFDIEGMDDNISLATWGGCALILNVVHILCVRVESL